ncbi:MAG: prepilin-type N-terminal cleavage/methylation domain-containing protein [Deltaproteobacteria bacterium]|nr:prepilin-type N-terminal cleavage/methylation domain-containing protein [Deltaproteobacteria bacterium]
MSARARGFTLLEALVSMAILALVATLVYGGFHAMTRARSNIERVGDRYQQGRAALSRLARELGSAFLSAHQPFASQLIRARQTAFVGLRESPADRLDFTSFSHRRLRRDAHESDQNELSYFAARDPDGGTLDLVRREAPYIDEDPSRGGVVQVLAEDIESFQLSYLDPLTGEWTERWDSTQAAEQFGRLPAQVWIVLVLRGARGEPIRFETKAPLGMHLPLSFAVGG